MGDMGEYFRAHKEYDKARKERNLDKQKQDDDGGWTKHTEWHWSRQLLGSQLDFWPSKNKWRWRNKNHHGDVYGFIRNRENERDAAKTEDGERGEETGDIHSERERSVQLGETRPEGELHRNTADGHGTENMQRGGGDSPPWEDD